MFDTYFDSAEDLTITRARTIQELAAHGVYLEEDFALFDLEMGVHRTYRAQDVLAWLGY